MAIPQYYFKALARRISGTYHTIAFAIDNSASVAKGNYMDYAISVSDLKRTPGLSSSWDLMRAQRANWIYPNGNNPTVQKVLN